QVDITLRAEPRRRTGAIEVHPDDPTGISREQSVEYRLDQIVHINGDYAPEAPRGNACIVQPRTRIAQVESKLTHTKVRPKRPSDQGFYTLKRNSTEFQYVQPSLGVHDNTRRFSATRASARYGADRSRVRLGGHQPLARSPRSRPQLWMLLHDLSLPFRRQAKIVQDVEEHDC